MWIFYFGINYFTNAIIIKRAGEEQTLKSQQQNAIFSLTWLPMARRAIKPDEMVKRLAVKKNIFI
jgi:hypothetical protein